MLSGVDGTELYRFTGWNSQDLFGWVSNRAGDVNGDGYDDVAIGLNGVNAAAGAALVYSGHDGTVLLRVDGAAPGDQMGKAVTGIGDTNGDGYADLLLCAPDADDPAVDSGVAQVYTSVTGSDPGMVQTYGAPCPTSEGKLPRIAVQAHPVIGQQLSVDLAHAPANATVTLALDAQAQALPLDQNGAPGCTLLALPAIAIPLQADASGAASFGAAVPSATSLIGASLHAQWLVSDDPANQLGLVTSDGAQVTIGQP